MHDLNRLGQSLEESMANEKLREIITDLGDVTLDQLAETGESLPIISFISKSIKAYNSIKDYFFMEKVICYLTEIANMSPDLRLEATTRIAEDTKYGIKFGKKILNIIDRFDDDIKAYYLAKAYRYLAEGQISLEFYLRLGTMYSIPHSPHCAIGPDRYSTTYTHYSVKEKKQGSSFDFFPLSVLPLIFLIKTSAVFICELLSIFHLFLFKRSKMTTSF
jgi:hypothetical protein